MQQVKYFMRAIGDASVMGVSSAQQAEDELLGYTGQGYEIESSHYLGSVKDKEGNEVGYRVLHVLVRYSIPQDAANVEEIDAPARRGRPRKPVEVVPA